MTDQEQHCIDQAEGARAANAGTTVHDGRAHVLAQGARGAHPVQELQERDRGRRHLEVGPRCVVEVGYGPRFFGRHVRYPTTTTLLRY